jgi:hypothetical protein
MLRELVLKAELEEGFARRGAAQGAALKHSQVRGAWVDPRQRPLMGKVQPTEHPPPWVCQHSDMCRADGSEWEGPCAGICAHGLWLRIEL